MQIFFFWEFVIGNFLVDIKEMESDTRRIDMKRTSAIPLLTLSVSEK